MKKIHFILLTIMAITAPFIYSGCEFEDCDGFKREPAIGLSYELQNQLIKISVFNGGKQALEFYNDYMSLPIDMNSDNTLYVFETSEGTDTLEFTYSTRVEVESEHCGIRMNVEDLTIGTRTTFDNVEVSPFINYFATVRVF